MMDEFIRWPKPYRLLSATSDEIWTWMIELWMKIDLVSASNCNTLNLKSPQKLQGMTNNVGLTFSVGDTTLCKTIRIGDISSVPYLKQLNHIIEVSKQS
jgi:hypothetical protein